MCISTNDSAYNIDSFQLTGLQEVDVSAKIEKLLLEKKELTEEAKKVSKLATVIFLAFAGFLCVSLLAPYSIMIGINMGGAFASLSFLTTLSSFYAYKTQLAFFKESKVLVLKSLVKNP